MLSAAHGVHFVVAEELGPQSEAQHVSDETRTRIFRIPVTSNVRRIPLTQHRVEERLLWRWGRKPTKSGRPDQIELSLPYRPVRVVTSFDIVIKNNVSKRRATSFLNVAFI